jgi:hypothetical protein
MFFVFASLFIGGLLNESLGVFWGCLFFHRRSFEGAPLRFLGLPLFSSEIFLMNSFVFFGIASFFIGGILNEPRCVFWSCLFFIRRLLNEPLCIFLGCLFFASDVF